MLLAFEVVAARSKGGEPLYKTAYVDIYDIASIADENTSPATVGMQLKSGRYYTLRLSAKAAAERVNRARSRYGESNHGSITR